jgi:hypothetical protein
MEDLQRGIALDEEHPFQILKRALKASPSLQVEVELALAAILERLNPSERGTRFLTGGAYEWVLAVACWASGIKTIPGGHSENGFDLLEYMNGLKGLWSLKSFTSAKFTGQVRIINKMSGGSVVWNHPTLFISPDLPGLTFFDPRVATSYSSLARENDEALTISASLIKEFAVKNPKCVIPFEAPVNTGNGGESPQLDIVSSILTSGTYEVLGPIMTKMKKIAATAAFLRSQHDQGQIDESTFKKMLANLEAAG